MPSGGGPPRASLEPDGRPFPPVLNTLSDFFPQSVFGPVGPRTHTDRPATVTRHQRAPAGRPSAGVRAEGSSGLRVRLQGSATGWRKRLLPSRVPTISVARPRRPVSPSGPPTEDPPEAASGQRWRARTYAGLSGKHDVSQNLTGKSGRPQRRAAKPASTKSCAPAQVRPGSPRTGR